MAQITVKVKSFEMEIECQAQNEGDAWAQITDYHSDEISERVMKELKITKAVYDLNNS